jgi:PKD repeat protein
MHYYRSRSAGAILGLALGLACAACRKTPSPSEPTSTTPSAARLTVRVDSLGSIAALPGVSSVRFDASGSSPAGPAAYLIEYGDGASSSNPVSEHVYETPGVYRATVTVADAAGRRTASETVTVRALEGAWFHLGYNARTRTAEVRRLTLSSQRGRAVSGDLIGPGGQAMPITGTLEGERVLRFNVGNARVEGNVPSEVIAERATLTLGGFADAPAPELRFTPIVAVPTGPPPVARLHHRIDSHGSTAAIAGLSPVLFSGTGSEGDSLQFVIEFGDGEYTTAPSDTHVCRVSSALYGDEVTSRLTVVDRFGRASIASRTFLCMGLVNHVLYGWINRFDNPSTRRQEVRRLRIDSHEGTSISGYYTHPELFDSRFTGTLSGERDVRIVLDGGGITFAGVVVSDRYHYQSYMDLRLTGGSADGMTLRFAWACGTYC